MKILAISPYPNYTKVGMFEDYDCLWAETQTYEQEELTEFSDFFEQENFRYDKIKALLDEKNERPNSINAFVAAGGILHPVDGGTYNITAEMLEDLQACEYGRSAANLGAPLAIRLATMAGCRYAYIVNPPVVDEMSEVARMTGYPGIRRKSYFDALNQKAVTYREAAILGKPASECNFIVCHIDRKASIAAHSGGKVVEVNDLNTGSGAMSLTQSGDIPPVALVDLCFSGEVTMEEIKERILTKGGLMGLLETEDFEEIVRRIKAGERKAIIAFEAFLYHIERQVGMCLGALHGRVDALILTGNLVRDEYLREKLTGRLKWVANVAAYPGADELLSLVEGAIRVLRGVEEAKNYA